MSSWWVHDLYQQGRTVELVSWVFWVILSITLHELAHGWAALWQGDDTPRRLGRMTMNPVVHMGPWSLLVFAVIGIAWGVMPVDPSRFRWGRKGRVVVSGAGPAMNLALCFAALTLLIIWLAVGPRGDNLYRNVAVFLWTGGWLNIILAVLNLMPVPPLDGSSILSGLSRRMYRLYQHPQAPLAGMLFIMLVFFTGIFDRAFGACMIPAFLYVDLAGALFGSPPVWDVVYG
ncbi:MAG: site-2 protease family protein [Planctomycetota bacterium]|nr:site-2 protease family protein [Planctomycetota bacterium]